MKTYFHVEVELESVWVGDNTDDVLESIKHHLWDCKTILITPKKMSDEEYDELMDKLL